MSRGKASVPTRYLQPHTRPVRPTVVASVIRRNHETNRGMIRFCATGYIYIHVRVIYSLSAVTSTKCWRVGSSGFRHESGDWLHYRYARLVSHPYRAVTAIAVNRAPSLARSFDGENKRGDPTRDEH